MTAPIDLEVLKDDLNIDDDYSDAWLQRRVDAIWSRIETYTNRTLRAPPATFSDEWVAVTSALYMPCPPPWQSPAVFLRQFPVTEILTYHLAGEEQDEALVIFDKETGRLLGLDGAASGNAASTVIGSGAVITYKAGWDELPAELYEIVLALVTPLWTAKQAGLPGALAPMTSISVNDVGSLDFATPKPMAGDDPMLAPYTAVLDRYRLTPLGKTDFSPTSALVAEGS